MTPPGSARVRASSTWRPSTCAACTRPVCVAGSCSGTLLLAKSGLLDGRRATTSWWLGATFRKAFPRVQLDTDQMIVDDGGVITTGAATAVLNLVMRLVAEVAGNDLAQQVGHMLAFDAERQSQAPYISMALLGTDVRAPRELFNAETRRAQRNAEKSGGLLAARLRDGLDSAQ